MTNVQIINLLAGVLLPLLVSLLTHAKAPAVVKSTTLLGLTTASSVLTTGLQSHLTLKGFDAAFVSQFATAVVAHFGLLQPSGVTGSGGLLSRYGLNLGAASVVMNALKKIQVTPVDTSQMPVSPAPTSVTLENTGNDQSAPPAS